MSEGQFFLSFNLQLFLSYFPSQKKFYLQNIWIYNCLTGKIFLLNCNLCYFRNLNDLYTVQSTHRGADYQREIVLHLSLQLCLGISSCLSLELKVATTKIYVKKNLNKFITILFHFLKSLLSCCKYVACQVFIYLQHYKFDTTVTKIPQTFPIKTLPIFSQQFIRFSVQGRKTGDDKILILNTIGIL